MTKATAPITGGIICAPFEAQASIAAASRAGMPDFFINGMVTTPTASALAAAMPEMLPNSEEATTAIFAAPAEAPHQAEREVVEKARAARAREQLPHQYEGDDDGAGDLQHQAEQAVVVEIEVDRRGAPLDLVRA